MAKKILFVDDEVDVVESQKSYLSKRGYLVFTATNTKDALETIKNESFDLVFCDIKLETETSGFDILEEAKKLKPGLDIFLITGYLDKDIEDKGLALGAKEIIHKPFSLQDLENKIKETLSKSK